MTFFYSVQSWSTIKQRHDEGADDAAREHYAPSADAAIWSWRTEDFDCVQVLASATNNWVVSALHRRPFSAPQDESELLFRRVRRRSSTCDVVSLPTLIHFCLPVLLLSDPSRRNDETRTMSIVSWSPRHSVSHDISLRKVHPEHWSVPDPCPKIMYSCGSVSPSRKICTVAYVKDCDKARCAMVAKYFKLTSTSAGA